MTWSQHSSDAKCARMCGAILEMRPNLHHGLSPHRNEAYVILYMYVALTVTCSSGSQLSRSPHLYVLEAPVVQDCAHILGHEVHTQHRYGSAAGASHLHRGISHDQGVRDVNVRPLGDR